MVLMSGGVSCESSLKLSSNGGGTGEEFRDSCCLSSSELASSEEDSRVNILCLTLAEANGCSMLSGLTGELMALLLCGEVVEHSRRDSESERSILVCFFLFLAPLDL